MSASRGSVRGIVVSDDGCVLLLKWRRPADGASFWLCPGGGLEDDEDDIAALARELVEETGLRHYELGPHVATWVWSNGYQHPLLRRDVRAVRLGDGRRTSGIRSLRRTPLV
ncbi:MAG: NUDIX hydrolase [Actinobacteria bacterium]|nr:NUDIX hydrolase [Actinomycetota bacterium]